MTVQPNALAAITAALNPNGAKPAQQPFTFVPQQLAPAAVTNPQVHQPSAAFTPSANPFQPSPQQAQAAFVVAVPQAAVRHAHPQTGVPFAPINPPGEASAPPTIGLDAAPVVLTQTAPQPSAPPVEVPKAPRQRKPRTNAAAVIADMTAQSEAVFASVAGDGAGQPAAASAAPSVEQISDLIVVDFAGVPTEALRNELRRRGWTVSLA